VTPFEIGFLSDINGEVELVSKNNGNQLALFVINRIVDFLFFVDIFINFFIFLQNYRYNYNNYNRMKIFTCFIVGFGSFGKNLIFLVLSKVLKCSGSFF